MPLIRECLESIPKVYERNLIYRQELISVDEGVEVVLGLLEDILDNAASIVYDHHLEREIFPYAVQEAKKSILKTIAVSFVL